MKFDIELDNEADQLNELEKLDEKAAEGINLTEIGLGRKNKENVGMFGQSRLNA